ncbi:hypothetical protein GC197_18515 [bacterium]|nr:hypothetical protein [bacterium]
MMHPPGKPNQLDQFDPPVALALAVRFFMGLLVISSIFVAVIIVVAKPPAPALGEIVFPFLGIPGFVAWLQYLAGHGRSQFCAIFIGGGMLIVAVMSATGFAMCILLIFIWQAAIFLSAGLFVLCLAAYWLAWQNWAWVQKLRGVEESFPLPRTLSIKQIMLLTVIAAIVCGFASMVQQTVEQQ